MRAPYRFGVDNPSEIADFLSLQYRDAARPVNSARFLFLDPRGANADARLAR